MVTQINYGGKTLKLNLKNFLLNHQINAYWEALPHSTSRNNFGLVLKERTNLISTESTSTPSLTTNALTAATYADWRSCQVGYIDTSSPLTTNFFSFLKSYGVLKLCQNSKNWFLNLNG
jgi:hypothetical protein